MFVDLEIIFNNTYGYIQFTYEVPINLRTKIDIGDIVTVPFRNVERQAIVLKVHNENIIVPNIKSLFNKVGNIDQFQLKYLEQIIYNYTFYSIIIIGLFATLPLMLIKKISPIELINKNI